MESNILGIAYGSIFAVKQTFPDLANELESNENGEPLVAINAFLNEENEPVGTYQTAVRERTAVGTQTAFKTYELEGPIADVTKDIIETPTFIAAHVEKFSVEPGVPYQPIPSHILLADARTLPEWPEIEGQILVNGITLLELAPGYDLPLFQEQGIFNMDFTETGSDTFQLSGYEGNVEVVMTFSDNVDENNSIFELEINNKEVHNKPENAEKQEILTGNDELIIIHDLKASNNDGGPPTVAILIRAKSNGNNQVQIVNHVRSPIIKQQSTLKPLPPRK